MLPCIVSAQDVGDGRVDVAAINPLLAVESLGDPKLTAIAEEAAGRLRRVIESV